MHLRIYADGSFANNTDSTSQLGFVVWLWDDEDKANLLQYSSHTTRRVVRSVLGRELMAFAEGMDYELAVREDIERITGWELKFKMFTDSKSVFDVITLNTTTSEKRLMVDIRAIREAYDRMDIDAVAWIRSELKTADYLPKVKENGVLNSIIDEGWLSIRSSSGSSGSR